MKVVTKSDIDFMSLALSLAIKARVIAPPNPWVGCIIVKDDHIVGEGFTQKTGGSHAEIMALSQAGSQARGATVYVTLEPCCHFGRTPPCVSALIEAGISCVFIGIPDPDKNVAGQGIVKLREAGIEVIEGVLAAEISDLLTPYLFHRKTGLPYCILKGAISLDGRIAAKDGTSQWISSPECGPDSHQLRSESQAIIVGSNTAIVDQPSLTVRHHIVPPSQPPLRVILDSTGRLHSLGSLFDTSLAPTLVITTSDCPKKIIDNWKSHGASVETASKDETGIGVDLKEVLCILGNRGILQVIVEGGGLIFGSFLKKQLFQKLRLYIGNCILGSGGTPLFATDCINTIKTAPTLRILETKILGNCIRIDYELQNYMESRK